MNLKKLADISVCEKTIVRQATNQILQITEKHHQGEIKNN